MADSQSYIRAKAFRRMMTPPEARVWERLRAGRLNGLKFRRQHPVGPFILDFFHAETRLAIEVDGGTHNSEAQNAHDRRRTAWLGERGSGGRRGWVSEASGSSGSGRRTSAIGWTRSSTLF